MSWWLLKWIIGPAAYAPQPAAPGGDALLLEIGDNVLLEAGDNILLE